MSEIKLNPCPFCGGKAIFKNEQFYGCNAVIVICDDCKAQSAYFIGAYLYDQAAKAWNRRTANDPDSSDSR